MGIFKTDPVYPLDVDGTIRANTLYSTTSITGANFLVNSDPVDAILRVNGSEAGKSIIKLATFQILTSQSIKIFR